jgi:hypothetical protein
MAERLTMKRRTLGSIAIDAFYDNFTCAALFKRLRIPGSPARLIDLRNFEEFRKDELSQRAENRSGLFPKGLETLRHSR